MGFLDALKKLIPKSEPIPWDAQSIRHPVFTLRLPEGWKFTEADWRQAKASGPANQAAEFYYVGKSEDVPKTAEGIEKIRSKMLELQGMLVKHDAGMNAKPISSVLSNGILWTEASETKGTEQRFAVYLTHLQPARMMQVCLRTSVPASSGALGTERLETLRRVMRSVQWT